jgi:N6-adenosine-specific RNA methylase IME4
MKYRTIVADPPWEYPEGFAGGHSISRIRETPVEWRPLPYESLSLGDIGRLPVQRFAADDARLFLWTTNRYLPEAFGILDAWGFQYRQTLVWHKTDANLPAPIAPNSAEFVRVGTIGKPGRTGTFPSAVFPVARKGGPGHQSHSEKPEAFLDMVEQTSPGPYLELCARRNRLGWDTWGNEALEHVEMSR